MYDFFHFETSPGALSLSDPPQNLGSGDQGFGVGSRLGSRRPLATSKAKSEEREISVPGYSTSVPRSVQENPAPDLAALSR